MKELTPAQYDSVWPLVTPLTHYGRVFADNADAPRLDY